MSIGLRVRVLRERAQLSRGELARLARVQPHRVHDIERGEAASPQVHAVVAIARVLGTSAEWLADGVGAEPTLRELGEAVSAARRTLYLEELAAAGEDEVLS